MKFPRTLLALALSLVAGSAAAQPYEKDDRPPPRERFDIGVTKKVDGPVIDGQIATFVLAPYNVGPSAVGPGAGVQVVDTLPFGFTGPVTWSGSGWSCVVGGLTVTCTYSGPSIPAGGAFAPITVKARAGGKGPYQNCAIVSLRRGPDVNKGNDRSCVGGPVDPPREGRYDVRLLKEVPPVLVAGQMATFTLRPHNVGPSTVNSSTGVTVVDTVPSNFAPPVSASGPGWNCPPVSGLVVTCTYIGPPVGPNMPLPVIQVTARARTPGGYVNCANIGLKKAVDARPQDNQGCDEGRIEKEGQKGYDVGINKKPGGPMVVGQPASFILNPFNTGPSSVNGSTGVVVVDILPPIFGPAVSGAGSGWNCSTSGTGPYTVTCSYVGGPIGPNSPMPPIAITATPRDAGGYTNCARIGLKANDDLRPRDNEGCAEGRVEKESGGKPDISLTKTALGQPWTWPSGTGAYELKITNSGGMAIAAGHTFQITEHLPAGMVLTSVSGAWSCTPAAPLTGPATTVCTYVSTAALTPGAWITMTANVAFTGEKRPAYENCAEARVSRHKALWPEADLKNNRDCEMTEVRGGGGGSPYDIGVNKEGPDVVQAGQTATWTVTPFNAATAPLSFYQPNPGPFIPTNPTTVTITDTLPGNFLPPVIVNGGPDWNCIPAGLSFTCTYTGDDVFGPGQPMPTITVQATASRTGETENCARAAIGGAWFIQDLNQANNRDCVPIVIKPEEPKGKDLAIEKTALNGPWNWPSGTGYYQFKITNLGGASVPAGTYLQVIEHVPAGMTLLSSGAWPCSPASPVQGPATVTCNHLLTAPLNGGASITFNMQMGFHGPKQPSYENCVDLRVLRGKPAWIDANLANNHDCAPVEVKGENRYDVRIDKQGPSGPLTVGQTATYTLQPTNTGPSPVSAASGLTVTDDLPYVFAAGATANGGPDWDCDVNGLAISCTYIGTATFNASANLPLITVTAVAATAGNVDNCAKIAIAAGTDILPGDNRDCVPVLVRTPPPSVYDLSLTKTWVPGAAFGAGGSFSIVVTNNGPPIPAGTIVGVTEELPPGMSITALPGGWSCGTPLPIGGPGAHLCRLTLGSTLGTGASVTLSTPVAFHLPQYPSYENCAGAELFGPNNNQLPELTPDNNHDCETIALPMLTEPRLQIEKVVEEDCTGTAPYTQCKFLIRVFNLGGLPYVGPLTFTDTITSFGNVTGGVSLASPTPPGWTCSGIQPLTCTIGWVSIPGNDHIVVPLYMTVNGAVPPTQNCAGLTAPQAAGPSCTPMGKTHYDLRIDSNFLPTFGAPGQHDLSYHIGSTPALIAGSQLVLQGSLTGAAFTPMTAVTPGWSCSGPWSSFVCTHTVGSGSFTGSFVVVKLRTSYPSTASGQPFTYVGTVLMNGNADPVNTNSTRTVNGTLP